MVCTFADVYSPIISDSPIQQTLATQLGLYGWDKGKDLRDQVVDTFYNSEWPPGGLALSARDPSLLRKLFKRVMRVNGTADVMLAG